MTLSVIIGDVLCSWVLTSYDDNHQKKAIIGFQYDIISNWGCIRSLVETSYVDKHQKEVIIWFQYDVIIN